MFHGKNYIGCPKFDTAITLRIIITICYEKTSVVFNRYSNKWNDVTMLAPISKLHFLSDFNCSDFNLFRFQLFVTNSHFQNCNSCSSHGKMMKKKVFMIFPNGKISSSEMAGCILNFIECSNFYTDFNVLTHVGDSHCSVIMLCEFLPI